MVRRKMHLPVFVVLAVWVSVFSGSASADSYPIEEKLEQCKKEFAIAHKKDVSQQQAMTARLNHLKLMKELLVELNKNNVGKQMSSEELQKHVMVLSHLMEMMVTENLAKKTYDMELHY